MISDKLSGKIVDWMEESFEARRELNLAFVNLRDVIFKELRIEQIVIRLDRGLKRSSKMKNKKLGCMITVIVLFLVFFLLTWATCGSCVDVAIEAIP